MDKAVIITAHIEDAGFLSEYTNCNGYIICADGGWDMAKKSNIVPDLLLGDFDSVKSFLPKDVERKKFPAEKDNTDLELAIMACIEIDAANVEILGGIGGRLDHTVANLQILSQYSNHFTDLTMRDGRNKCFVLRGDGKNATRIPPECDSYISLFAMSESCTGVTFENVKYPLENHTVTQGSTLCVSNEFAGTGDAFLSLKEGTLLVVISKK